MQTKIISGPHFVTEALFGIGLSYGLTSGLSDVHELDDDTKLYDRLMQIARGLAHKPGGGHNKFLETITLTLDVKAPRYWWQEFDTYRVGVTKQSESTMHTIMARELRSKDFEGLILAETLADLNKIRNTYIDADRRKEEAITTKELFLLIKNALPEGYLQRRIVCLNAKALQNMYTQRRAHRLPEWHQFFNAIKEQMPGMMYGQFVSYCIFGGPEA